MCRASSGEATAGAPSGEGASDSGACAGIEIERATHEPGAGARGQCGVSGEPEPRPEPWASAAPEGVCIAIPPACAARAPPMVADVVPIPIPGMHVDAQTPSAIVSERERSASSAATRRKRDFMAPIYPSRAPPR